MPISDAPRLQPTATPSGNFFFRGNAQRGPTIQSGLRRLQEALEPTLRRERATKSRGEAIQRDVDRQEIEAALEVETLAAETRGEVLQGRLFMAKHPEWAAYSPYAQLLIDDTLGKRGAEAAARQVQEAIQRDPSKGIGVDAARATWDEVVASYLENQSPEFHASFADQAEVYRRGIMNRAVTSGGVAVFAKAEQAATQLATEVLENAANGTIDYADGFATLFDNIQTTAAILPIGRDATAFQAGVVATTLNVFSQEHNLPQKEAALRALLETGEITDPRLVTELRTAIRQAPTERLALANRQADKLLIAEKLDVAQFHALLKREFGPEGEGPSAETISLAKTDPAFQKEFALFEQARNSPDIHNFLDSGELRKLGFTLTALHPDRAQIRLDEVAHQMDPKVLAEFDADIEKARRTPYTSITKMMLSFQQSIEGPWSAHAPDVQIRLLAYANTHIRRNPELYQKDDAGVTSAAIKFANEEEFKVEESTPETSTTVEGQIEVLEEKRKEVNTRGLFESLVQFLPARRFEGGTKTGGRQPIDPDILEAERLVKEELSNRIQLRLLKTGMRKNRGRSAPEAALEPELAAVFGDNRTTTLDTMNLTTLLQEQE